MSDMEAIDTGSAEPIIDTPRDYEAEARAHGWTGKDDFRGDPGKWVDAETFVKRADEVMPFLKKQNEALKREMADIKRQMKRSAEFFSQAEERAYKRAMTELEAQHNAAVEEGDVAKAKRFATEMRELSKPELPNDTPPVDEVAEGKKLAAWIEASDWYMADEPRTKYADMQANAMGKPHEYDGGTEAWLAELERRVDRKFAEKKPNPANPAGNRSAPRGNGRSYADLPPEAKAMCDKWVRTGTIKSREDYVKNYQWG